MWPLKVVHRIDARDFKHQESVKEVFTRNSKNRDVYSVQNRVMIQEVMGSVVTLHIATTLGKKQKSPTLVKLFFPERKYAMEYVIEENQYTYEFLYQMLEAKEYFNMVFLDEAKNVITSITYVFDGEHVMEYPFRAKDYSDLSLESSVDIEGDQISMYTVGTEEDPVVHTWQNVGQHYVFHPAKKGHGRISHMDRNQMSPGLWMLIVTDGMGKLLTQFLVYV